ncbi:MAG: AMP-binding protein [Parachlamydiales bacterium]
MRKLVGILASHLVRWILALRYRVKWVGLDQVPKEGGLLFLPNHPALIDPVILSAYLWPKWEVRPLITEYIFYIPGLHTLFTWLARAVPIPAFVKGTNSYKEMRSQQAFQRIDEGLAQGDNFLIYPAGRLKRMAEERLGGTFGVYERVQGRDPAKVILVRTRGLWGSIFGWGQTGKQPTLGRGFGLGFKTILKNLLLFTPRRTVTIELAQADPSLLNQPTNEAFNRALEEWYNSPEPEPLTLVPYSAWSAKLPEMTYDRPYIEADLSQVPPAIQHKVRHELAKLAKRPEEEITPEKHLMVDLGLDSLDIAELVFALEREERGIAPPSSLDLLTVGAVMALAAGIGAEPEGEEAEAPKSWWEKGRLPPLFPEGETIGEVFLHTCDRMGHAICCGDTRSGVRTYSTFKRRALLLAEMLTGMPGERIGILLPASVACATLILACTLAGKVPVMLNWTLGRRSLDHVKALSNLTVVLSSWAFLDRMEGADLTPLHEAILPLEELMGKLRPSHLWKAYRASRLKAQPLLKRLGIDKTDPQSTAVLLFTSGTEAIPKGVPLSHHNLLSNQRSGYSCVHYTGEDSLLSILPPFHSLGFSIATLLPLLTGGKVLFSPNPTDSRELARLFAAYRPTVIYSAPTFLRDLLRTAKPEQLASLWELICGAEKAPEALFEAVSKLPGDPHLLEGYGITECSPLVTVNRPGKPRRGVGPPIPGVELLILHPETHEPLPTGQTGLILISGPGVFSGYLNSERDPFLYLSDKRWYNSGDLGYLDAEGYLTIAGRLKRFVKIGGEMISLPALESELEKIVPEGGTFTVIAKEEEGKKPVLHLFSDRILSLELANKTLQEAGFSNLARLAQFHKVDEMPLLGTGKVNFRALQDQI